MKRITLIFLFFVYFIFCSNLFAQPPEEIYRKANLNYENEKYEEAISLYEKLVEIDKVSPEIYYNLGNSFFKLKKIGKAIVNYKRALHMAPRDRDIRRNLKLARGMRTDKIEDREHGFILNAVFFLYDRMSINELTVLSSIIYLLIGTFLIFSIFFVAKRKTLLYTAAALSVFLILFLIFLASKIRNENFVKHAVAVSKKVDVRSGPKEDYLIQFSLHEGAELMVVEKRQNWYEIELSKDLRGWVPKDSVEII